MIIERKHIQPMGVREMLAQMRYKGKGIFLLSLPGNLIILGVFLSVLFPLFDYAASLGFDQNALNTLRLLNNTLMMSLTGVHIFYLLIGDADASYLQQMKMALLKTLKMMPTLIGATIAYTVFTSVGLVLFVIPGLLLYAYLGVYAQTIAFENQGVLASLMRSRDLVRGSFWRIFGLLVSVFLLSNMLVIGLEVVLRIVLTFYPLWLDIGVYMLTFLFLMPFMASLYALIYFDLRSRQEAFDYHTFHTERNKIFAS